MRNLIVVLMMFFYVPMWSQSSPFDTLNVGKQIVLKGGGFLRETPFPYPEENIMRRLYKGEKVTIVSVKTDWDYYMVETEDGNRGYISSAFFFIHKPITFDSDRTILKAIDKFGKPDDIIYHVIDGKYARTLIWENNMGPEFNTVKTFLFNKGYWIEE